MHLLYRKVPVIPCNYALINFETYIIVISTQPREETCEVELIEHFQIFYPGVVFSFTNLGFIIKEQEGSSELKRAKKSMELWTSKPDGVSSWWDIKLIIIICPQTFWAKQGMELIIPTSQLFGPNIPIEAIIFSLSACKCLRKYNLQRVCLHWLSRETLKYQNSCLNESLYCKWYFMNYS